jgi:hypothetical protein
MNTDSGLEAVATNAKPERVIELACVGMAAASLMIVVACLSGLPSTSCMGIAQSYEEAIKWFGVASLLSILAAFSKKFYGMKHPFARILIGIASGVFVLAIYGGVRNLDNSIDYCYVGDANTVANHLHRRTEMWNPIKFLK